MFHQIIKFQSFISYIAKELKWPFSKMAPYMIAGYEIFSVKLIYKVWNESNTNRTTTQWFKPQSTLRCRHWAEKPVPIDRN